MVMVVSRQGIKASTFLLLPSTCLLPLPKTRHQGIIGIKKNKASKMLLDTII
jgi:hypothetical protein